MFGFATTLQRGSTGEDRLDAIPVPGGMVFVVADGASVGIGDGAHAAEIVCAQVRAACVGRTPFNPGVWAGVLARADVALAADPTAGQCAAIVLEASSAGIVGACVGNSGAWIVAGGEYSEVVTGRDPQSLLLGSGTAKPTTFQAPFVSERLVIASDGLWAHVDPKPLLRIAMSGSPDRAVASLTDAARLRSGGFEDDLAIIIADGRG